MTTPKPEATPPTSHPRRQLFRALEARSLKNRPFLARFADYLTALSSTPIFLFINIAFFVIWILGNIGVFSAIQPFDPYPFGLLTMAVSLEAIILSIFVLVSQNRASQIATLRDELNLRVNLIAEQEITKILEILETMRKKMNIDIEDPELAEMLKAISATDLEHSILEQIERADKLLSPKRLLRSDLSMSISGLLRTKAK